MPPVELTPLPYATDALQPILNEATVRVHHDVHQAAYVRAWNDIMARGPRGFGDWENLAFNGAGIVLHELYWLNLTKPGQGERPSPELDACICRCFGSPNAMAMEMVDVGKKVWGSGWVVLAWSARFDRMLILPVNLHQYGWIPGVVPLLVIDVWEHAFECQYGGERAPYLQAIWHLIDWNVVSDRYKSATSG